MTALRLLSWSLVAAWAAYLFLQAWQLAGHHGLYVEWVFVIGNKIIPIIFEIDYSKLQIYTGFVLLATALLRLLVYYLIKKKLQRKNPLSSFLDEHQN